MIENHFCPILFAAVKISGHEVDCARKCECNLATACVLVREIGGWENLTQYFVKLADVTYEREQGLLCKSDSE